MAIQTRGAPLSVMPTRSDAPASATRTRTRPPGTVALTGRGGVVAVFGCTAVGAVVAAFGPDAAQGVFFVVGCLFASARTRRTDLLAVVVAPPATFFTVTLLGALVGGLGGAAYAPSVALGLATTLISGVGWLLGGTLLVVAVGLCRGLPSRVRELRDLAATEDSHDVDIDDDPVRWDE